MEPLTIATIAIVGSLGAWGAWYAGRSFRVWRRLHGDRVVTCPETGKPAAVRFDISRAVLGEQGAGGAAKLESCSRWNERGPCDEDCARAAQAPESAASAMVREWAKDRHCVSCGVALLGSEAAGHHIALRDANGFTREWVDVSAERLPIELATSTGMCWNCHVAETFRRTHPELVTDRDDATVHVKH